MEYELFDVKRANELTARDYIKFGDDIARVTTIHVHKGRIIVRGSNAMQESFLSGESTVNVYRKQRR